MPTTRSKANGVTKDQGSFQPRSAKGSSNTSTSTKRKADNDTKSSTPAKKLKKTSANQQAKIEPTTGEVDRNPAQDEAEADANDEFITINRAPVLELWSSCVAQFLNPSLPWAKCLSIGGAISTITAISKGRSIGTIDKPNKEQQREKQQKRREEQAELDEVTVMTFHLKLKDGQAVVGQKPKKANEEALKKKFGEKQYEKAKQAMEESLDRWNGQEDELDNRAFHMYEDFRPSVASGQKGWGRKGQLSLKTVRDAVSPD